ncbi:MAG TPA: ElyC/SanA/YdcF family protein [Rhodothermales bacterium]
MGFILKKIAGLLAQPLSIVLLLLVVGLVLLWRPAHQRWGRRLILAGTALLFLVSLKVLPYAIGRELESRFPPYQAESSPVPEYVVVLGGGIREDAAMPLSSRLSQSALARVVEATRIAKLHPEARLVVSGGYVFTSVSEADVAAEVAQMLGIDSTRIVREDRSRDTRDQARLIRDIVGNRPFVLVTSAIHMPRSMALFEKQGLHPIPAPTGYFFDADFSDGPRSFLPTAEHLRALEVVLHEIYGMMWSWLIGAV